MEAHATPFRYPHEISAEDFLAQFVSVFGERKWLGKSLCVSHRGKRYRIWCSEREFLAYRINNDCGVPPGFPGWPVCMVNTRRVIEDAHIQAFESHEPCAYEWLVHLADGEIEILQD